MLSFVLKLFAQVHTQSKWNAYRVRSIFTQCNSFQAVLATMNYSYLWRSKSFGIVKSSLIHRRLTQNRQDRCVFKCFFECCNAWWKYHFLSLLYGSLYIIFIFSIWYLCIMFIIIIWFPLYQVYHNCFIPFLSTQLHTSSLMYLNTVSNDNMFKLICLHNSHVSSNHIYRQ